MERGFYQLFMNSFDELLTVHNTLKLLLNIKNVEDNYG